MKGDQQQTQESEIWQPGSESKLGASVVDQSQDHAGETVVADKCVLITHRQ